MRSYEVMAILDSALEEQSIKAVIDKATALLEAQGASGTHVDKWGRRRLAYPIAKKPDGYYVLISTSAEPAALAELSRTFQLSDDVVRHKVIRLPDGVHSRTSRPEDEEPKAAATDGAS